MTQHNAFQTGGFNEFNSIGYNARNGGATPDLYLLTRDGVRTRLVKINGGNVVWAVTMPANQTVGDGDLTINANGIYTLTSNSQTSAAKLHRFNRAGEIISSANGVGFAICSNQAGGVFVHRGRTATKWSADLVAGVSGNTASNDIRVPLSGYLGRRCVCAPDGDPYFAIRQQGAGGGYARGLRSDDLSFYPSSSHVIGVRQSLNQSRFYTGNAPSFTQTGGNDQGLALSFESGGDPYQAGIGRGFDFGNLLASDDIGSPRSRQMPGLGPLPSYIATSGNLASFGPRGSLVQRYDGFDNPGTLAPTWSVQVQDVFEDLPRGANITNAAYAVLPHQDGSRACVWGMSFNSSSTTAELFVGEMTIGAENFAGQWLLMNDDIGGVLGAANFPAGVDLWYGIVAGVIDQPGEGYSDPDLY